MRRIAIAYALVSTTLSAQSTDATRYAIIPRPAALEPRTGTFTLTARTVIHARGADTMLAHQLARDLAPATGFALRVSTSPVRGPHITLRRDAALDSLGPEGYQLDVTTQRVELRAPEAAGLFYGVQSLRQLLPPAVLRGAHQPGVAWTIPAVRISDRPRFSWRGAHLDVGRHFMPVDFVKKWIDLLALHKLNTFHWHLTDDQGWRLEIRKYPRLTEVGGCRPRTLIGPFTTSEATRRYDESRYCGFYTQDDVREIVAYAAARHITVVPEIEMPGHAQALLAAYPQLGVYPDSVIVPMQVWGVSNFIMNVEESTIAFMHDVLDEVMAFFPSPFIHIGGDEADKTQWKASARVQERMRELGMTDEHALQSWFIRRMDAYLTSKGRRLIGWDEILEGGLAPNAAVMSWRGTAPGVAAAKAGHDVVMAPTSHTYLDYYQSADKANEPLAFGGFLPLDTVYTFEPIPPDLTEEQARHVLGAQAQHWTEYMRTPRHVEYMAFPRLGAFAEVVWTRRSRKDLTNFHERLRVHMQRLAALGVDARPLERP
ncbi:MAG TPA: beta-N-acetylhexosaminidase [Gemmatimonadaceae bacterium]|nr:beta-N-acetylhexosaminidase [Gemmatimonadaceae bacterium]